MASSSSKLYDAFISHRGPDVKEEFAIPLYKLLEDRGCRAFVDRLELEKGDSIVPAIESAIRSSVVQIAIFSKGYAHSPWCLDELVLMLEQRDHEGARFIPVFYDVDPFVPRHNKEPYAEAFRGYKDKGRSLDKLEGWKRALHTASNVIGFELKSSKSDLYEEIVSCVEKEIEKRMRLNDAAYPVGLSELVRDFERRFEGAVNERANIVGIFGLGGCGKTTMAKRIFNTKRSNYNASCFLYDVRESHVKGELHVLQSRLVKDLFKKEKQFQHTDEGTEFLKDSLRRAGSDKSFLIILDDVDNQDQLHELLFQDLLSRGSLVIVTTRDEGVLKGAGISNRYKLKTMDSCHAKELFCNHAFGGKEPKFQYEQLVERFVQFCGGLPLSLKVLGSHVCGRDEKHWNLELEKARDTQPNDVRQRLKISFDSLDTAEKYIFMNIACFYNAKSKDTAIEVLKKSYGTPEHAIQRLVDKCLVDLEDNDGGAIFRMHDHLRDLGRQMADEANWPWRPEDARSKNPQDYMIANTVEPRMVFAHYMLYEPDGVETLKKEIQVAHNKGIDAFALNSNVWRPNRADDMFQAALDSDTNFKLFFSADMSINSEGKTLSSDDLIAMLTTYADHPNYLKYKGKLFFASWLGENTPWPQIFKVAGGKDKFFFVPFFPTSGDYDAVREKLNDFKDIIDGLSAWDTSAWPYEHSNLNSSPSALKDQNYLKACKDKGKLYMPNASPWFFNDCNCTEVKGNYEGPGLWITKWQHLISLKPPFVKIVTWNDWQESTYVAPPYSAAAKKLGADTFSHAGFLELGKHYIKWYKSGQEPAIAEEVVYLFYYTQPNSISEGLSDNLYVTTMLNSAADGELMSGELSRKFSAAVGINTYSMPFQVGQQSVVLKRGGAVVSTLTGDKVITNPPPVNANLNVYSTWTKIISQQLE
ncbi:hypothetical protein SUGI_1117880 [Cryptomeria japonica]|uniref:disease resistance protein RPV1 n=1 Tax=Cryptomeria japonica TaxID=3369 RepID=UPI0024147FF6|nr:disease resistance protein RPV1 [Cryptomeria japonica]GLJ52526.1 hypothetical protein SUGI_1117880 [Cryptomeria japonica]